MADRTEIVDALESLAVHCRPPLMSVDDRSRWMKDWCDDLRQFPGDAIRTACGRWRQGENTKFPTPGQLLPLVRSIAKPAHRPAADDIPTVWKWPSEEELSGMTLREKRRQYLIMANEAHGRAGPMGNDGNHPRPEWIATSKRYLEEAQIVAGQIARGAQKREDSAA